MIIEESTNHNVNAPQSTHCRNAITSLQCQVHKPLHFNPMPYRHYVCILCGYIYDEEKGDPDGGLAPGTRFEDIPDDWRCPECDATKEDFELIEI